MKDNRFSIQNLPEVSFLVLVFSLGFMQPTIFVGGLALPVTDAFFVVTFCIWLLAMVLRKVEFQFGWFYLLLGLYAVGVLPSVLFSENPTLSSIKYLGVLYLIGLAVMTFNVVRSVEMFKKVILVWLAASALTSIVGTLTVAFFYFGITNFVTDFSMHHFGSLPPGNYPRLQSTFLYPAMLCNYLTVSLLLLFAARKIDLIGRTAFGVLAVLFAITIAFTFTPGVGGVMLAAGLWFWAVYKESGRPLLSKAALSGAVLSALIFLFIASVPLVDGFVPQRPLTWLSAINTFLTHPIFGKGLGLPVADIYFLPPGGGMQLLTDAHNIVISVAAQSGLVGLIPLILICIFVIRRFSLIAFPAGSASILRCSLGISFISAFLYQGLLGSFEETRHLWVLIGLIMVRSSNLAHTQNERR